jgi:hypothetical protein
MKLWNTVKMKLDVLEYCNLEITDHGTMAFYINLKFGL